MLCRPSSVYVLAHRAIARAQPCAVDRLGIELSKTSLQETGDDPTECLQLALCMGTHQRLGRSSPLYMLPDELVQFILSCKLVSI